MNVTTDNGLAETHERLATRPERARTNSPNPPTNTHSDVGLFMAAAPAFAARQDVRRV